MNPKLLDPLRKTTVPIDVHYMNEEEIVNFNTRFNTHRYEEEAESESDKQEEEDAAEDSEGYGIEAGGNTPDVTMFSGRFSEDKGTSSSLSCSTPRIPNNSSNHVDKSGDASNTDFNVASMLQNIMNQMLANNSNAEKRQEELKKDAARRQEELEKKLLAHQENQKKINKDRFLDIESTMRGLQEILAKSAAP